MDKQLNTNGTVLAFATYKPKPGQEQALMALVEKHLPTLRELQLASDRNSYLAKSTDGTIIEVFEWVSTEAIETAHQHPRVGEIWDKMGEVADFHPITALPEGNRPFPSFEMIN